MVNNPRATIPQLRQRAQEAGIDWDTMPVPLYRGRYLQRDWAIARAVLRDGVGLTAAARQGWYGSSPVSTERVRQIVHRVARRLHISTTAAPA